MLSYANTIKTPKYAINELKEDLSFLGVVDTVIGFTQKIIEFVSDF